MVQPEELFTTAQQSEIFLQYGKLGSATLVWRWFRKQYPEISNHRIPAVTRFWRLKNTGSTSKGKPGGHKTETMTEENIELI